MDSGFKNMPPCFSVGCFGGKVSTVWDIYTPLPTRRRLFFRYPRGLPDHLKTGLPRSTPAHPRRTS